MDLISKILETKKSKTVNFTSVVMAIVMIVMLCLNLINHKYGNSIIAIVCFLATIIAYFYYRKTKNYRIWTNIYLSFIGFFGIIVFYSGGTEGAGILWSFLFPFFAIHFKAYKNGIKAWFAAKDLQVTVVDDDGNGTVEAANIYPNEPTEINITEELQNFQEHINNIEYTQQNRVSVQQYLQSNYGEVAVVADDDLGRGGNANGIIDAEELKFVDASVDGRQALHSYQMANISGASETAEAEDGVLAFSRENAEGFQKYLENKYKGIRVYDITDKNSNGYIDAADVELAIGNLDSQALQSELVNYSRQKDTINDAFVADIMAGTNYESENILTEEPEWTAFISNYFSFPISDNFMIDLSFLLTSNPALVNDVLTRQHLQEGIYPGGISLNQFSASFLWDIGGFKPVASLGFLPNPADNWQEKINFNFQPETVNDAFTRTIDDDRLGAGFSLNYLPQMDNDLTEVEVTAGLAAGPHISGGLFGNENPIDENLGFFVEETAGVRNTWHILPSFGFEYGLNYIQNNKAYKEDNLQHTYSGSDLQEFLAVQFNTSADPTRSWLIRAGVTFGQNWEVITNNQPADYEAANPDEETQDLKKAIDSESFTASYTPFIGVLTPNFNNIGQFELSATMDISNWSSMQRLADDSINEPSSTQLAFSLDLVWKNALEQDWLSFGIGYGHKWSDYNDPSISDLIDSGLISDQTVLDRLNQSISPVSRNSFTLYGKFSF